MNTFVLRWNFDDKKIRNFFFLVFLMSFFLFEFELISGDDLLKKEERNQLDKKEINQRI